MPELVKILEQDLEDKAYAFAFYEETLDRTMQVGRVESVSSNVDRGMVLRIVYNGRNYETATNNLEPENLQQLAAGLNSRVKALNETLTFPAYKPHTWAEELQQGLGNDHLEQIPATADAGTPVHFGVLVSASPLDLPGDVLMEQARNLRNDIINRDLEYSKKKHFQPLAFVMVNYRFKVLNHIFVDRVKNMSQSLPVCLAIMVGQTQKGRSGRGICGGMGGPEVMVPDAQDYDDVIVIPHALDHAQLLKPGNYQVITGPDVTGVFAHEAFGHTQEGDTCRQGRSITSQFQDTQVGNDQATIVNNAAIFSMGNLPFGTNGSYFFDHEGELARAHNILEKGYLKAPMTDLLAAIHLGIRRTANGKRESWRRPTLTRQTNTYFTAGDKTLDEIIAMVKGHGFLATVSHGGMEDPKGANLTAGAEYFLEIVKGKITGRYFIGSKGGHIELSGFVPDLLKGILAKSKINFETKEPDQSQTPVNKIGGCGKYHKELVPAGSGGPYILWAQVTCG